MATGSSRGAGVAFACIAAILGVGVLVLSLHSAYRAHRTVSQGVHAEATVFQILKSRDPKDNFTVYRAVFRFRGDDGRFRSFLSGVSGSPRYQAGQHVTVFYEKGHPEHARIESLVQLYALASFGSVFGAAMIAWSFLVFLQKRRGMGPPEIRIGSGDILP